MVKLVLLSALCLFTTAALATVNGRCSGEYNDGNCICLEESTCKKYHSSIERGTKGHYPCPFDGKTVIGCYIGDCAKVTGGPTTACTFSDGCKAVHGTRLSNPTCPGGDNFFCCKFNAP